jgi:hypothetical protein
MLKEAFIKKAQHMGDFYLYFKKNGATVYGICTAELTEPFMKQRTKNLKVKEDEVILWNWRYHCPLVVKYSAIKQMSPLSLAVENARSLHGRR